ncbi:hypothetical protein SGCOL_006895 [Colletotrichum sp. CLE4]
MEPVPETERMEEFRSSPLPSLRIQNPTLLPPASHFSDCAVLDFYPSALQTAYYVALVRSPHEIQVSSELGPSHVSHPVYAWRQWRWPHPVLPSIPPRQSFRIARPRANTTEARRRGIPDFTYPRLRLGPGSTNCRAPQFPKPDWNDALHGPAPTSSPVLAIAAPWSCQHAVVHNAYHPYVYICVVFTILTRLRLLLTWLRSLYFVSFLIGAVNPDIYKIEESKHF